LPISSHVDLDLVVGHVLQLRAQDVDAGAFAPDDHAGARRVDHDMHLVRLPLDVDAADARLGQRPHRPCCGSADPHPTASGILLAGGKPAAPVFFDNAQAKANGMNFATQVCLLLVVAGAHALF
jgi:hypothetical protein